MRIPALPIGAGLAIGGLITTTLGWLAQADLPPGSPDTMLMLGIGEIGLAVGLMAYGLGKRWRP